MIVALPKFNDIVAPSFEVARYFVIVTIDGGKELARETVQCAGCKGFARVALVRDSRANVLVCNGIKEFYRNLIESSGISIYANVSGTIDEAIDDYLAQRLHPDSLVVNEPETGDSAALGDLICWTTELFTAKGYAVRPGADRAPFPVDLIAEIECPLCHKPVRVAICCGAHAYRSDQEIKRLHQVACADYHAQVYIHSSTTMAVNCCAEYGIELIDPHAVVTEDIRSMTNHIPLLKQTIVGHEQASGNVDLIDRP